MARKDILPEDLTAICDTREQRPVDLSPMKLLRGTLTTADYSILGLEHEIAVERKSLDDLISCIGGGRERFEKELKRLAAYPARAVVVESSWEDLNQGNWRGKITIPAAVGSVLAWMSEGIPFLFAGSHDHAGRAIARYMFVAARRRFRELQAFHEGLKVC